MKLAKRILAVIMMAALAMALTIPAFAASDATAKITVPENTEETYTAYKIFDVTTVKDGDKITGYAYTIAKDSKWVEVLQNEEQDWFSITLVGDVYNVSLKEGVDGDEATAKAAAAFLLANKGEITEEPLNKGENAVGEGYYLITSTRGTNLVLATITNAVNVAEKNVEPTVEKKVKNNTANETTADNSTTASIGDTVEFSITISAKKGAKSYVLHDEMSDGLTLNAESITVKVDNTVVTAEGNYTIKTATATDENKPDDSCTFEIVFTQDYLNKIAEDTDITVTYTATVNEKAKVGDDGNSNKATLKYGENSRTTTDESKVYTYSFDLIKTGPAKTDANNNTTYDVLTGAKFKLYDAKTGGNEIPLVKVSDSANGDYYRPATTDGTGVEIEAGEVTIKGLGSGTYYLEETEAPAGYNKLTERTEVKIENANRANTKADDGVYTQNDNDTGIQVINQTGSALPSTGGIGTTIFYVAGGFLAVGAVVLMVVKKRMSAE